MGYLPSSHKWSTLKLKERDFLLTEFFVLTISLPCICYHSDDTQVKRLPLNFPYFCSSRFHFENNFPPILVVLIQSQLANYLLPLSFLQNMRELQIRKTGDNNAVIKVLNI